MCSRSKEQASDVLGSHGATVCVERVEYGDEPLLACLREAAHAEEAVERARALVAVDGTELGPANGQVAVGARRVLKDEDVEGAVHRLDL